ncbi:hypothetical protein TRFO_32906 [Tritrichomonas foetus]|uniref:Uncharacterized protein n=1 Tax=Tritrichomonas foetus TaxID=1144522 RepID=A0A1J4JT50_9EUKA|nr:hypothetical protein TRFO_32906 [Tritrichomonas foetus]|eukprot:OHT00445.1 hypothetical protein TRFO_32906 [Tritrichomonas foetus]
MSHAMKEIEKEELQPIQVANYEKEEDSSLPLAGSMLTFSLFLILECINFYQGYMYYSPIVNCTTIFCPLIKDYNQTRVDLSVNVNNLTDFNSFLRVDMLFIRYTSKAESFHIVYKLNYTAEYFLSNQSVLKEIDDFAVRDCYFHRKTVYTRPRTLFYKRIYDFDEFSAFISIDTNLSDIKAVSIIYFFVDAKTMKFMQNSTIFLTLVTLVTFLQYLKYYKNSTKNTQDFIILILGLLSVFSVNIFSVFSNNHFMQVISPITMNVFLMMFRIFSLYFFDSIHKRSITPSLAVHEEIRFNIYYMLFQIYYEITRDSLFYVEYNDVPKKLTLSDLIMYYFHLKYIYTCFTWYINALKGSTKQNKIILNNYGRYILVTLFNTLIVQVLLKMKNVSTNTGLIPLVYQYPHIIATIIFLNMKLNCTNEYQMLNNRNQFEDEVENDEKGVNNGDLLLNDDEIDERHENELLDDKFDVNHEQDVEIDENN